MKLKISTHNNSQNITIGHLEYNSEKDQYSFDYSDNWLQQNNRFALCPTIPFNWKGEVHPDKKSSTLRLFLQNLLPEGKSLDDIASANKISKTNVVGILKILGRETTGALSFSPENENEGDGREGEGDGLEGDSEANRERNNRTRTTAHSADDKSNFREVKFEELSQRIQQRDQIPFSVWDGKVRLSIAGYQDKLLVLENQAKWFLVEGATQWASTQILKPEPWNKNLTGMTTNEFYCMQLSNLVGLPTAPTRLKFIPDPVLVIERFDRQLQAAGVRRHHCVDGCQALGLAVSHKYERPFGAGKDVEHIRDGASLKKLFHLINEFSIAPAADRIQLLRWTIFQILIGNADAHAKNISFFMEGDRIKLAPTYDLLSVVLYEKTKIENSLAFAIGDSFSTTDIRAFDWALMAHECRLPPRIVAQEVNALATKILRVSEKSELKSQLVKNSDDYQNIDHKTINKIRDYIEIQCQKAQQQAPLIKSIPKTSFD